MPIQGAALWARLKLDGDGLITAVVQHAETGQVLMVGYQNLDALTATLDTGLVTFWSRSRGQLWRKGESSGHTLSLVDARLDCDADALLLRAIPRGPTCHTGSTSCFFQRVEGEVVESLPRDDGPRAHDPALLGRIAEVIAARKAGLGMTNRDGKSYVRKLLDGGVAAIGPKIREESDELVHALEHESDERVASEAADLLFHTLVGLAHRGVGLDAVARVFEGRFGVSGIDEKKSRA